MSKGLEALHRIANAKNHFKYDTLELVEKDFQIVQQELLRLESINNSKPSEALEAFDILLQHIETEADWKDYEKVKNAHKIVEQALQKAQEQEKVLNIIKNKEVDMKLFFNALFREQQYKINPLEFYNGSVGYKRLWLTQEEFELLKRYYDEQDNK